MWDGQIYDLDLWAIPKGATNKEDAKRFIAFATEPAQMAAQAELIAYGPMRKSAIALVGKHPSIDIEMKGFLPTAPDNFKKALQFDEVWWNEHGDGARQPRFKTWREQPVVTDAKARRTGNRNPEAKAFDRGRESPNQADAKAATAEEKSKQGGCQGSDRRRKAQASGREALDAGGANRFRAGAAPKPAPNLAQQPQ